MPQTKRVKNFEVYEEDYGKDAKAALYASKNKGVIKGVEKRKDPLKGTGKTKGSRRLYTDENPRDTVPIKFATPLTLGERWQKLKRLINFFARKIQILTVVEQRAKVAGKTQQAAIAKRGKEVIRNNMARKR